MVSKDIETSAAVYPIRTHAVRTGKPPAAGKAECASAAVRGRREPRVHIERTLAIDPGRPLDRIGVEALEALLAEIGAEDQLTLRLSLHDATPVRLGLDLAAGEAERHATLTSALDFATALINTERRA